MSETPVHDYIIVGQGLAGSLLAHFLRKRGKKILVIDAFSSSSSSQIAAGLVHPITGRRLVKTWMADTAFPFAFKFYDELKKETGTSFFQSMPILEIISNAKQWNDWTGRKSDPEISDLIGERIDESKYSLCLHPFLHLVPILNSGWLNLPSFLHTIRTQLKNSHQLLEEEFDYEKLVILNDSISYKENKARRIIFCEGYKISENPFWSWVPMLPAKGEILTIETTGLPEENILMKSIFIVPLGSNLFRVGSTYSWSPLDEIPTEGALQKLTEQLDEILKVPYRVISQKAGVRPTVKDRRPLLGLHPQHPGVYVFNGLGTKGVSLGPFFASHFVNYLEDETDLSEEVNVQRFWTDRKKN
ncbi:MAG: FAD-binding oxidoreductase [Bacteroidetes bacterium]|nr:FAD-binding oxidoreductase [Bacteroidota bacterium]MBP6650622.1 FAD-binding oxidoreductase [Bacteroidia bacterium]